MADRLKGITIEIGGDTSGLSKALKETNSDIKNTQSQLKDVNKLLKLDPTNTELLRQKQILLSKSVEETSSKLETLKKAQEQMDQNGIDKNSEQYMALQREIIQTETDLKSLEKAAESADTTIAKISATAEQVASGASKIAQQTKALSTAAAAGLTALAGAAYSAVTSADDLNTLAKQTGFTTAELQKMEYAADLVDVSMDDITSAATKLKKNMSSDSDSVVSAFKQLGVATTNADGSLRDSTEVFWETIEALSYVGNETERDTLAMTLLGKGADSLAGIIDDGAEAFNDLGDEAEEAGLIMSQDTLDSLNEVNDELDKLKATAKAELIQAGAKALEALEPVLEQVVNLLSAALTWIGSLSSEQITLIATLLAIVAAISPIMTMVSAIATLIANPLTLAITAIIALVVYIVALIATNLDTIKEGLALVKQDIIDDIEALKQNIVDKVTWVKNTVLSIVQGIGKGIKAIINAAIQAVQNGINRAIASINSLITAFNRIASAVASAFGGTYSGIKTLNSVSLPKLATGGIVTSGSAIVGEAGPELLTVAGGKTQVTPLTATLDSKALSGLSGAMSSNINIKFSGSLSQLAQVLQPVIEQETVRRGSSLVKGAV